jgi:hypothetical protein
VKDYDALWWQWFNTTSLDEMGGIAERRRVREWRDAEVWRAQQTALTAAREARRAEAAAEYDRRLAAMAERAAERRANAEPNAKQRRSNIDWAALTGDPRLAARQQRFERCKTATAMREAGMTFAEIGRRLGVTKARAASLVDSGVRCRRSPIEAWMAMQPTIAEREGDLSGMLVPFTGKATPRDWMMVASHG